MENTTSALVSFGNYLLEQCNVQAYDIDGKPYALRQMTDADIANWQESIKQNH